MKKLPRKIQQQIKMVVYEKADEHCYMTRDRISNGVFMENLVRDSAVGGVLTDYMSKPELKTYIKDAILNRYAKDKMATELSLDRKKLIKHFFHLDSEEIPIDSGSRLSLHRLESGEFVVISCGTLIKWETALRKALELIAKAPTLSDNKVHLLLRIAAVGKPFTESDKKHLNKALSFIGVRLSFAGDHADFADSISAICPTSSEKSRKI